MIFLSLLLYPNPAIRPKNLTGRKLSPCWERRILARHASLSPYKWIKDEAARIPLSANLFGGDLILA